MCFAGTAALEAIKRSLFLLSTAAGTMLPRNLRTGGYDLPGVESSDVPLIGYRPLPPDGGHQSHQLQRESGGDELETSQVSAFFPLASVSHVLPVELPVVSAVWRRVRYSCSISHSFAL